jgi:outer membrane receptor for ferrienterochelin and colicin
MVSLFSKPFASHPNIGPGSCPSSCELHLKTTSLARLLNLSATFLLLILGAKNNCVGQDATTLDLSEASLEQLGNIKVYSASKHLQAPGDAPSSITVITANEIQEQGYRTLADILRTVRGFFVTYNRNYSSLGVRGFARPGDFNTRILLLVDGHRLNDNVYDEAMIGTELPFDIDLIQRIEIVRGPVSSLYGSNALFAVINIITKRGQDLNGAEYSAEAGSFDTYKGRISYGHKLRQLEFLISGSFYGSLGQNRLFYPEFNTIQTNSGIANHADDDQLGSALASIAFRGFILQSAYGTREKGIPTGAYGTIFNNSGTRTTDSHGYIDFRYAHTFANGWDLSARTFFDKSTYQGTYIYPSPINPVEVSPNLDFADGQWWGADLQVAKTVLSRNRITAGGEYRDNIRQNQSNFNLNPYSLVLDDRRKSFVGALYLQDEFTISKSLALNAGIRYDYYSSVNASTDPRLALIYRRSSNTAFKFIYGEAFRAPNVYEKYYSVSPNLPNPTLNPEKIRSTEFVWEQGVPDRAWLSASAFHTTMVDLITQEPVESNMFIFRNVQDVESNGLELELKGKLSQGLNGTASYSFQETKDRDTKQFLSSSPRNLGKLNLIQPLLKQRMFVSLDAQYRSRIHTLSGGSVSPFSVFNINLLGRKIGEHMDLSAGLYNVLDKRYFDPSSSENLQDAIQQDGRTFRVKMTWHLGER